MRDKMCCLFGALRCYFPAPWNADPDYLSFAGKWPAGVPDLSVGVVTLCPFKPTLGTKARKEDLVSTGNLPLDEGKQSQNTPFSFPTLLCISTFLCLGKTICSVTCKV